MHHVRERGSFILIGLLLFGAGCGGDGFAPEAAKEGLLPGSEGRELQLARRSTHCGAAAPLRLAAFVGPGAEFTALEVSEIPPPCPDAPSPRIDVHVEGESVLIDFSTVEAAGVFPGGGFEGYVIYFRRSCRDMALSSASIDEDFSSVVLGSADVQTHFDHLDVNLQGVGYDDSSFIKIDLSSVYVSCLRES